MDFVSAIKIVKEGGSITRESWQKPECYCCMREGFLSIKAEDGNYRAWTVSEADVYAQDWKNLITVN